jgi:hypothetical protein
MTQVQRSVQTLLDRDALGLQSLFHQINFPLMHDRGIRIEAALHLNTEYPVEIELAWKATMQIRRLSRLDPKALVVQRQIVFQKSVGGSQTGHLG